MYQILPDNIDAPYLCLKCNCRSFRHPSGIKRHLAVCGAVLAYIHQCQLCNYKAKHWTSLKYHMNKIHAVELTGTKKRQRNPIRPIWNCDYCSYFTEYKKNLKPHVRRMHKEAYKCLYGEN